MIDYEYNQVINSFFVTETNKNFIITRGFSDKNILFSTDVIYLNNKGIPYMCYNEVLNSDNVLEKHYRKINSKNQYSLEGFDNFLDCLNYKPEIR